MKGLGSRIARLERVAGIQDDVICVIVCSFVGGELSGYRTCGHASVETSVDTIREPGESDAELLERAEAEAKAASPRGSMITFRELRANSQS